MTRIGLAVEAWRTWVKGKPIQSEDTAKGFMAGFNFCLSSKIKVEGGDKGELISENWRLQDRLVELERRLSASKELIKRMNKYLSTQPEFWSKEERLGIVGLSEKAFRFLEED
jgi:hypothetical protein